MTEQGKVGYTSKRKCEYVVLNDVFLAFGSLLLRFAALLVWVLCVCDGTKAFWKSRPRLLASLLRHHNHCSKQARRPSATWPPQALERTSKALPWLAVLYLVLGAMLCRLSRLGLCPRETRMASAKQWSPLLACDDDC